MQTARGDEHSRHADDEGPREDGARYRDYVKEARYGRGPLDAHAYPTPEPRYGDPRYGAYDSVTDTRPRYSARVSDARFTAPASQSRHGSLPSSDANPYASDARKGPPVASAYFLDPSYADPRYSPYTITQGSDARNPATHLGASYSLNAASSIRISTDAPVSPPRIVSSPQSAIRVIVASPVSDDADGEAEEEDEMGGEQATQREDDAMAVDALRPAVIREVSLSERLPPMRGSSARSTPQRISPIPPSKVMPARGSVRGTPVPVGPAPVQNDIDADIAAALDAPTAHTAHDDVDAAIAAAVDAPTGDGVRSRHTSEARSRHASDVDADLAAAIDADADLQDAADAARAAVGSRSGSRVAYSDTPSHSSVDDEREAADPRHGPHVSLRPALSPRPASGAPAVAERVDDTEDAEGEAEDEDDELLAAVDAAEAGERV